jgi:drug/metabolite transporter (DMT)-like permease
VSATKSLWPLALALGIVYVVWGSTYLAIRVAVEDVPPFLMAGGRWVLAAMILLAVGAATRQPFPTARELGWAALVGCFLLIGGNGLVVWAEQYISSGMAALLVGSLPLWVLGLEAVAPGGDKPTWLGVGGILMGLAGVTLLVWPSLVAGAQSALWAQGLVLVATLLWAIGTLIGRRVPMPRSGLYNSGFQMLAASLGFCVLSAAFGEPARFDWAAVSRDAWLAWGYLVVFGSCIAFSAFAWLVQNAKPDLVSTYAYVNPVVAVALGAWLLNERVDAWTVVGAALVVASVALVVKGGRPRPVAAIEPPAEAAVERGPTA